MRVAVTGAAGRLGRSVVSVLREHGHDVVAIDRDRGEYAEVGVDLTDRVATRSVLEALTPEAVVHLAAIAVPFSAPEHEIFTVNTSMAFGVIEAAIDAGATRVIAASSPTVLGYGAPGWRPASLPLDEASPRVPSNAYALSKACIEDMIAMFARTLPGVRLASFRPCYVVAPEEWSGALTQQGHSIEERLRRPELSAVALFNYVDARDAGDFVAAWLVAEAAQSGSCYFVGAADALAPLPLASLLPQFHPGTAAAAEVLQGTAPAFDSRRAREDLGWHAERSWRTELPSELVAELDLAAELEAAASLPDQKVTS